MCVSGRLLPITCTVDLRTCGYAHAYARLVTRRTAELFLEVCHQLGGGGPGGRWPVSSQYRVVGGRRWVEPTAAHLDLVTDVRVGLVQDVLDVRAGAGGGTDEGGVVVGAAAAESMCIIVSLRVPVLGVGALAVILSCARVSGTRSSLIVEAMITIITIHITMSIITTIIIVIISTIIMLIVIIISMIILHTAPRCAVAAVAMDAQLTNGSLGRSWRGAGPSVSTIHESLIEMAAVLVQAFL